MSKVYSFKVVQNIPVTLKVAWDFFSAPENLKDITPETMGFKVKCGTWRKNVSRTGN